MYMFDNSIGRFLQGLPMHSHPRPFFLFSAFGFHVFQIIVIAGMIHIVKKKIAFIFIILLLPLKVSAHGLEPILRVGAGVLPGSPKYLFERMAEWVDVNLLTVSTKKKEQKKLALSSERIAELGQLANLKNYNIKNMRLALSRYESELSSAEDMTEKIIFLDGAEIAEADNLEMETRMQEKFLREQKESAQGGQAADIMPIINEAVSTARINNEKIFTYMVQHYQATDADVRKHRIILSQHITLAREAMIEADEIKSKKASKILDEAEKFRLAGLNEEAYRLIKRAKDALY